MTKRIILPGFPYGLTIRVIGASIITIGAFVWALTMNNLFSLVVLLGQFLLMIGGEL